MSNSLLYWICCQLGAREHYSIPRALYQSQQINCLITDTWITNKSLFYYLAQGRLLNLRERFHPDLSPASVYSFTNSLISFELQQKVKQTSGWQKIIARNEWFQERTVDLLKQITPKLAKLNQQPILFAYSYAALDILRYAKSQGWRTILGQIDPGIIEENIVREEHSKHKNCKSNWQPAPPQYWKNWQLECELADKIVVNSSWSNQALQQVCIPEKKIEVIPLAYELGQKFTNDVRTYPQSFSKKRPLKVLFLGQIIFRKGIASLLEAAKLLENKPIEFWLVGSLGITQPELAEYKQIKWIGSVPRSATASYYREADVFLFPTLSDGFGLTQLEAQAWKLPIIASRFCGEVVKEQVNGLLLPEVTPEAIAEALNFCLDHPQHLQTFSDNSIHPSEYNLLKLQHHLQELAYAII
ncbi:MAG: glycosyltransferase family 4 protein [Dolichospermum sp. LBC05a]|nr:glycosyltransferase family 4 protein [Dolichospermum sp. OL01]MCO5796401.1 glycosyltransferase family 4 protein [Dolichospermum sp. OL03]MCS6281609.1 glycosyltransferase family 4 protein [Dolichospermum sp.]QSV58010.1 MAG: glycosyltransferase family 4 protein [Dolichospermum sp. LBC05a]